jgi:hypothetical protein
MLSRSFSLDVSIPRSDRTLISSSVHVKFTPATRASTVAQSAQAAWHHRTCFDHRCLAQLCFQVKPVTLGHHHCGNADVSQIALHSERWAGLVVCDDDRSGTRRLRICHRLGEGAIAAIENDDLPLH